MNEIIIAVLILVMVYLTVRMVRKFREISSWRDEDPVVGSKGKATRPKELLELKIDEPPPDNLDSSSTQNENKPRSNEAPPKKIQ